MRGLLRIFAAYLPLLESNSSMSLRNAFRFRLAGGLVLGALVCCSPIAFSQEVATAAVPDAAASGTAVAVAAPSGAGTDNLPDAPGAQQGQARPQDGASSTTQAASSTEGKQTKRILYVIPNFRSVSVNEKLPPQTVKDKFVQTTEDSFDYSGFIFAGVLAGAAQAQNSTPEFHQGAVGYGRYYWHSLADQANENYWVEFILPSVLHQDSRYYTMGQGGFVKRATYAFSRVLITRTDSGGRAFNASEIVGAGASSGVSDLYYPGQDRTWTKTGQRWLLDVGIDGFTFAFKEFWPDINNAFVHQKN